MNQRILVSAFMHQDDKALLLKRGKTGFLANHWEMPGGKLEFGEDPVCSILRETKEEAGLEGKVICPYHSWHTIGEYKGEQTHFVEIDFIMKIKPNHGF